MKVLFLHSNRDDYLSICTFHGLRTLLGENCVDAPRFDCVYDTFSQDEKLKLRGKGFSIYGLLPEISSLEDQRSSWKQNLSKYDLLVIADIGRFYKLIPLIRASAPSLKIAVLDGMDNPAIFPFESIGNNLKKQPGTFFTSFKKLIYFKRELDEEQSWGSLNRILPSFFCRMIWPVHHIHPLGFSFPEEKITKIDASAKKRLFSMQLIDKEIADQIHSSRFNPLRSNDYLFDSEASYYQDLQEAKFGITGKRAGWDCLRHYEMAANGMVLCFRDLDQKPEKTAPLGLNASNSIGYNSYDDLMEKIANISEDKYAVMQQRSYDWIIANTTRKRAEYLLSICKT